MTMTEKSFRDLIVWQKAMDLLELVYRVSSRFPREENDALTNQLRRAAVSIPSNIAEGHSRRSPAEFGHFLSIARGSLAEVETQLLIAFRLNYINQNHIESIMPTREEISKMLHSRMAKLQHASS